MRGTTRLAIAIALLGATAALAVDTARTRFADTRRAAPEVLVGVPLKSVITEFLDPSSTGLGPSLAAVVWSEVGASISDQAGSGVVLVVSEDAKELVTMLGDRYHDAALQIAGEQRARMVLWGVVEPVSKDSVAVQTYLSVLTKERGGDLRLRWNDALEAGIRRTRFNFAPVVIRKDELARRTIVTRASTGLRAAPSTDAPVVATVRPGSALYVTAILGAWFEVAWAGGRPAYARGQSVRVVPVSVSAEQNRVPLRQEPGAPETSDSRVDLNGSYPVVDMRERSDGTWYQIKVGERSGWIEGWRVRPRRLLPAEHFVAGLYRYYDRRFEDAAREFRLFAELAGATESNVNLAAAWQLAGASEVMSAPAPEPGDLHGAKKAFEPFDNAVLQTPYDPTAYMLRCVADAAILRDADRAVSDLDRALELNPDEPDARALAVRYRQLFTGEDPKSRKAQEWAGFGRAKEKLDGMMERYRISATHVP